MKLKLGNLIYVTDDAVKIARLKEMGAVEVEEPKEEPKKATAKTTAKAEKDA